MCVVLNEYDVVILETDRPYWRRSQTTRVEHFSAFCRSPGARQQSRKLMNINEKRAVLVNVVKEPHRNMDDCGVCGSSWTNGRTLKFGNVF